MEEKKNLATTYNPKEFEERIYKTWEEKKYFTPVVDKTKKPFSIVMPPPNITGRLHLGHALDNTLQDMLIRFKSKLNGIPLEASMLLLNKSNRREIEAVLKKQINIALLELSQYKDLKLEDVEIEKEDN